MEPGVLPATLTSRDLAIRAYDDEEQMIDFALINGEQLDEALRQLFANESADQLRIYNAGPRCWAANVQRAAR